MKDDRLRSPVKQDYINALGRAAFTFSTCEWQVVWCSEKIKPGALKKIVGDELTAGAIAKMFIHLTRNMPSSNERDELKECASKFMSLVTVRNKIIHGKPCTGQNGEARLSSKTVLEISDLEDAADRFVECSSKLNNLFYGFLSTYTPADSLS